MVFAKCQIQQYMPIRNYKFPLKILNFFLYVFVFVRILNRIFRLMNGIGFRDSLPASAAESAANAAIEKLNEPGVENNLFSDIRNGGAVCECMLFSISSSLFEL